MARSEVHSCGVKLETQAYQEHWRRVVRDAGLALALAVALAACGSAPKQPRIERGAPPDAPPTTTRGGGYYLDDGPGANPPADLDRIPDAQPRAEPLHRAANRPYSVFGREYVPMRALAPYKAQGVASWYGRRYHGQRTSIGEIYDMYTMTAAHPTLPIPSYVRVTSLTNGRSVVVRVNDRGPFLDGRLIDLSYAAAYRLGYINQGSAPVEVELILPGQTPSATVAASAPPPSPSAAPAPARAAPAEPAPIDGARVAAPTAPGASTAPTASIASSAPAAPVAPVAPIAEAANGVFVQLGAFAAQENAEIFRAQLASQVTWLGDALRIERRDGLHRIQAGPYADRIEALAVAQRIREAVEVAPVLVVKYPGRKASSGARGYEAGDGRLRSRERNPAIEKAARSASSATSMYSTLPEGGGTTRSSPGFRATGTRPGFEGCLNWRRLPRVATGEL